MCSQNVMFQGRIRMSKFFRVLFYVSLAVFAIRLGVLNEDPDYVPPPLTLIEFTCWATAWVFMSQCGMSAAKTALEEKLLGILSWAFTCGTITAWVIPYQMDNTTKVVLLTFLCAGLFFPISNVTTWRPWGATKDDRKQTPNNHDFAQHSRR